MLQSRTPCPGLIVDHDRNPFGPRLIRATFCLLLLQATLALFLTPGSLLLGRKDGENLRARLLGDLFDLLGLLVRCEGFVFFDVLFLLLSVVSDRFDFVLLFLGQVQ